MTAAGEMTPPFAQFRVARPTDRLAEIAAMYERGLGFTRLAAFADHEGFDGVVLGHAGLGYQIEFTTQAGHRAGQAPTADNLLVFYLTDTVAWEGCSARMEEAGFRKVPSWNPYWDRQGRTFEDPDGYRVVLQNSLWPGASS